MSECAPIPCPSFQEAHLEITDVCSCAGYIIGNKSCPIHGIQVQAFEDGWNAAMRCMKSGIEHAKDQLGLIGTAE